MSREKVSAGLVALARRDSSGNRLYVRTVVVSTVE